jgi:hypothetical protein
MGFVRVCRPMLLLVAIAVALVACRSQEPSRDAEVQFETGTGRADPQASILPIPVTALVPESVTTMTEAVATTAVVAEPVPESSAAPTTSTPPVCSELDPILTGAIELVDSLADVDGDAKADLVTTYGVADRSAWYLRVGLGRGGSVQVVMDEALLLDLGFALIEPAGAVDLDGDGADELFVIQSAGAASVVVGLYDFEDCRIVAITDVVTGKQLTFPIGESVTRSSGVTCEYGDVAGVVAMTTDGELWEAEVVPYEVFGSLAESGLVLERAWTGDGVGSEISTLDCPGVVWSSNF